MSQDNRLLPLPPMERVERGLDRPLSDLTQPKSYGVSHTEPTHLRDYLNVVLKRKWLILGIVLVVTTLVTIQMYRLPSTYEAQTTIQIEPKRESILKTSKDQIVINTGRSSDPAYINTQLRLLENPTLARQVIRKLDLQNNPAFLGAQTQAGFVSSIRRILAGNKQGAKGEGEKSEDEVLPVVPEGEVTGTALSPQELERLEPYEDTLAANLTVEPVVSTNLVALRYRHTNPEMAQRIVNALADTFVQNNIERDMNSSEENTKVLGERIAELQQSIKALEDKSFQLARNNRLTTAPGGNLPGERLAQYSKDLLDAEKDRKSWEALYNAANNAADPNAIPQVQENARIQVLRKQLDDLEQQHRELLVTYTPEWPAVKQVEKKIAGLKETLAEAPKEVIASLKKRYEAARAKESAMQASYARQYGVTGSQGMAQMEMNRLNQELETKKQEYNTLRQRQRELENAASDRVNNVSVTTYSRLPREPVGPPRVRTIILAFLLAVGAGIGLAFLLDYLDDTLKTIDDVDRYIHLPALALIPSNRTERPRLRGRAPTPAGESTALALMSDVRSPVAEAYRHLRTSLLLSSAGQPPKTILVTSSQPSEGKTTTAINTAIMLAQTGAEVLIIDCDLRRPRVHANFGVSNARGLTNCLSGEKDYDTLMQSYDQLPNLKLLTSGPVPPNPAELLGSNEMRRLLNTLAERFTHIVIDSPPAISFTDASILSTLVDGVMLVVHGGRSSRAVVRRAKQQLIDVGANIFGVVLNNVKMDSPDYYYSGYYSPNYYSNEDYEDAPEDAQTTGASPRS